MNLELNPIQREILDRIASGEATRYNELYGGGTFDSYDQHPQVRHQLPSGAVTTAAGRYQMTWPTWELEKRRLGLKDFSPQNQDLAALDLAERTYAQRTGRSLEADQADGTVDWSALGGQWTSLRSPPAAAPIPAAPAGAPPELVNPSALEALLHSSGNDLAPRPKAPTALPSVLLQHAAPGTRFQPIDYNPFALGSHLEPVEGDPFQTQEPSP